MGTDTSLSGEEDGTETVTNSVASGAANHGTAANTGGDGGTGPLRVGIFATNGATRVTAGASYWGIMELSGNLWERPVSVGHAAVGRLFQGTHGTGTLDLPSDWPGTTAAGTGSRCGAWGRASGEARVSDRARAATADASRAGGNGWRAVRSAPSGVVD